MKRKMEIWLTILLVIVLPWILLQNSGTNEAVNETENYVSFLVEDTVVQMDVEEYLVGVLLAEMPADFEIEALKAQAVAARTFAIYKKDNGGKHENADLCISAACCQGYVEPEMYINNGGAAQTVIKMYEAVCKTSGQVLVYKDALIEATYFSSSGGRTEDAMAVWGTDIPYLQSVDSREEQVTYEKEMKKKSFLEALELSGEEVLVEEIVNTEGGGIDTVRINGCLFTGLQLRSKLNLRSTNITFLVTGDSVQIVTKGHGHRVGLSQYGADAMAANGSNYSEILSHYYTDIEIVSYTREKN